MKRTLLLTLLTFVLIPPVFADTATGASPATLERLQRDLQSLSATVSKLNTVIEKQQATINLLMQTQQVQGKQTVASPPVDAVAAPLDAAAPAGTTARTGFIQNFNPDIGIVGDIVGTLTQSDEDAEGNDRISLRHLELVMGHDIDPYSRFDATIAFSDEEDPDVEEGYITHWGLPAGFIARLGRIRPKVGIAAPQHRDTLDTVDEPLVVSQLFGEEGFSRTGLELSNFVPVPWETVTHEIVGGIIEGGNGHGGTLFGDTERAPTMYSRLKNSWDISDDSLLLFGTTFLAGSTDEDAPFEVRAFGGDVALTHSFNPINRIKFQSEFYLQDRDTPAIESDHGHDEEEDHHEEDEELDDAPAFRTNPLGFYSLIDYRLAERWSIGGRFDYAEAVNDEDEPSNHETAYTTYLTFHQSEFARWRFQYQAAEDLDGETDNRFFLQATVAIGTHKHAIQ